MKGLRRHHNNKGNRKVRTGKTYEQVKRMAKRLKLPFGKKQEPANTDSSGGAV